MKGKAWSREETEFAINYYVGHPEMTVKARMQHIGGKLDRPMWGVYAVIRKMEDRAGRAAGQEETARPASAPRAPRRRREPWTRREKCVAWRCYMRSQHLSRHERCEVIAEAMDRPVESVLMLMGRIRVGDEPRPFPELPAQLRLRRALWFAGLERVQDEACPACRAHPRHVSADPLSDYCELCEGIALVPAGLARWWRSWADGDGDDAGASHGLGRLHEARAINHWSSQRAGGAA